MNDDTWVTCPYNAAHRSLKSRLQIHLARCRITNNSNDKKQCPYDANHIINALEYEYHVTVCESRESVLHYQSTDQDVQLNLVPVPVAPLVEHQSEEDWDAEGEVSSYQPLQNIKNRPVFIQPTGLPPAERRNFRRNERGRHLSIENRGNTWQPLGRNVNKSTTQSKSVLSEADDDDYVPLRKPNKIRQKVESVQSPPTPLSTSASKSSNSSTPQKTVPSPKAPASTSAWKSVNSSNQKVMADTFKTPAPTSAGKTVVESNKKNTVSLSNNLTSSDKAFLSTGTVPKPKPAFSYANALRTLQKKDDGISDELSRTFENVDFFNHH